MGEISPSLPVIITLNIKEKKNYPIKNQRLEEQIIKCDLTICWLQEIHFMHKKTNKLEVKEDKNIFHASN